MVATKTVVKEPKPLRHKFVNTTGGPKRKICLHCGKFPEKVSDPKFCDADKRPGLLTTVWGESGEIILDIWTYYRFRNKKKKANKPTKKKSK